MWGQPEGRSTSTRDPSPGRPGPRPPPHVPFPRAPPPKLGRDLFRTHPRRTHRGGAEGVADDSALLSAARLAPPRSYRPQPRRRDREEDVEPRDRDRRPRLPLRSTPSEPQAGPRGGGRIVGPDSPGSPRPPRRESGRTPSARRDRSRQEGQPPRSSHPFWCRFRPPSPLPPPRTSAAALSHADGTVDPQTSINKQNCFLPLFSPGDTFD